MGAIGHPGDIERLRMAAIELASTEGFTRSAADVSLRRLAYYSLSPLMKERVRTNLRRALSGATAFCRSRLETGGRFVFASRLRRSIATNGATFAQARQDFAVLSGTRESSELMEAF